METNRTLDGHELGKFRLALGDQPVAHVLVGREQERAVLLQTFQQASAGSTVFLMIEGPAGIGKTALVEAFREALPAGVLFAEGVDDEAQQHIPCNGLRQALSALLRQLLAQHSQELAAWRHRLRDALGTIGDVLGDLVPELEQLLGPQPAPADLAPAEQRERLHDAVGAFLAGIAGGDAPMLLFLDDLHWAGRSTLDLLPYLVTPRPGQALLVVGSLRTEDAELNDAWEDTLARMASSGVELHRMTLTPLSMDAVNEMCARTLGDHCARTQALAEWLHRLTGGNPLHASELLAMLIREDALISPDETPGANWRWDPAGAALSDDLAALLARHLHSLTPATQSALTAGAHLGASFTLCDLAVVQGCTQTDVAALLAPDVQNGNLLALDTAGRFVSDAGTALPAAYRFRHDRIAETAVALTPETVRPALHLRIGRALLGAGPPDGRRLLEVTSHLNAGRALMVDPAERLRLAELNLAAGRADRAVSDFAEAWENTRRGLELLPGDAWQTHYDLALALHVEGAVLAPVNGQPVALLVEPVLANARMPLDTVEAYYSLILAAAADGRFDEALHVGNRALAALGETPLPLSPSRLDVLLSFAKTRAMLWGKSMDDLRNAPPVTDPHAIAVERILLAMLEAFQVQYRELAIALAVLRIVQRTQAVGRSPLSAYGYAGYATLLTAGMGNVGAAIEYGRLALDLAQGGGSPWLQNRVELIWFATLAHRVQPLRGTLEPLRQVSRRALAIGDVTTAVIAALIYAQHVTTALDGYGQVLEEVRRLGQGVAWQGRDALALDFVMELQFLRNLMGQSPDPVQFVGDTWDESSIHDRLAGHDNTAFLGSYHVLKATLAYLHHDYARALEHADAGRDGLARFASLYAYPTSLTIDSLIRLAMAPLVSGGRRRQLLRQVAANQRRMAKMVRQMPANLDHTETTKAVLLSREPSTAEFAFEAECTPDGQCVLFKPSAFFSGKNGDGPAPPSVVNFAANTAEPLTIKDAGREQPFASDPTVRARGIKAVLCLPLRRQGALIGLLYLENDQTSGVFGEADISLLTLVATQAILVLENARLSGGGASTDPNRSRTKPRPRRWVVRSPKWSACSAPAIGPMPRRASIQCRRSPPRRATWLYGAG